MCGLCCCGGERNSAKIKMEEESGSDDYSDEDISDINQSKVPKSLVDKETVDALADIAPIGKLKYFLGILCTLNTFYSGLLTESVLLNVYEKYWSTVLKFWIQNVLLEVLSTMLE